MLITQIYKFKKHLNRTELWRKSYDTGIISERNIISSFDVDPLYLPLLSPSGGTPL